jgi:hypothetical protein
MNNLLIKYPELIEQREQMDVEGAMSLSVEQLRFLLRDGKNARKPVVMRVEKYYESLLENQDADSTHELG